ncbi:MAG: replicative DNA helicase [Tannerellaceae bacterium]|nr:replicative DNA helicase [Tannerellaceae bacterium]
MKDKLPPQAIEMEQAVLGAILLEKEALQDIESLLVPDDFYAPAHIEIYKAILALRHNNHPVDMLTVTEELSRTGKLDGCGGAFYISTLTSMVASASHLQYHALIVKEKADARRLIQLASGLLRDIYTAGNDFYEVREQFEQQFTSLLTASGTQGRVIPLSEALNNAVRHAAHIEELKKSGQLIAIPTGIDALDKALDGGWRSPELIVLAGRPSMGKTQFALWFAKAAAAHKKNVLFTSIEMDERQLAGRYILEDDRIRQSHFRGGEMDAEEWAALHETVSGLWHLPIQIASDHKAGQLSNIKAQARRLKRRGELDLLMIDYLTMIRTGGQYFEKRYLEVGHITLELKNLAKELGIPIILLAQLNRLPAGQPNRKPVMSDLRESGNIEQDADIILFLHKPDFYTADACDNDGVPWKGRGMLIVAKQREGERSLTLVYNHDTRYKKIW